MHRRAWLSTLGFLLLLSPAALAQPRDPAAGDRLFKEGRAAFDKGDYATACPKFAESQKADPAPGTILNLALCEERLGKVASARGHVVELLAQLDVKDDRIPIGKELFNKLDARVARFSITLAAGAPPSTLVRLVQPGDSRPLAFGSEIFLDPGTYRLEISAPGRPDSHTEITLTEGQRETRAIAPAEAEKVKDDKTVGGGGAGGAGGTGPGEVPTPPSSAPLRRTIGFVAGGVGVASFIVAGITGGIIVGKNGQLAPTASPKLCDTDKHCNQTGLDIASSAKGLLPVNTATWIIGIAGVGAGAVLILTSLGGDKKEPTKELPVTPSAAVLPGGGGVSLSGRF